MGRENWKRRGKERYWPTRREGEAKIIDEIDNLVVGAPERAHYAAASPVIMDPEGPRRREPRGKARKRGATGTESSPRVELPRTVIRRGWTLGECDATGVGRPDQCCIGGVATGV